MSSHNSGDYDYDRSAKKARKTIEQKHKSRRRHDDKQHLKDFVDGMNYGRKEDYDDFNDEE